MRDRKLRVASSLDVDSSRQTTNEMGGENSKKARSHNKRLFAVAKCKKEIRKLRQEKYRQCIHEKVFQISTDFHRQIFR